MPRYIDANSKNVSFGRAHASKSSWYSIPPSNPRAAGVSMYRVLPSDVNLEDIKKEAMNLLYRLRERDGTALRRYYSFDPLAGMFDPRIDDAQYVIAREYGYASWRRLIEHHGALPARKIPRAIAAGAR